MFIAKINIPEEIKLQLSLSHYYQRGPVLEKPSHGIVINKNNIIIIPGIKDPNLFFYGMVHTCISGMADGRNKSATLKAASQSSC